MARPSERSLRDSRSLLTPPTPALSAVRMPSEDKQLVSGPAEVARDLLLVVAGNWEPLLPQRFELPLLV